MEVLPLGKLNEYEVLAPPVHTHVMIYLHTSARSGEQRPWSLTAALGQRGRMGFGLQLHALK
eukprot:1736417-Amphidinium_carterae.1